ncbi:MAG: TetR/AcrR family transcriptional regulator [Pseudomonadales bacterium]|nr:TetR/AcrR family transcriptional regulator [Pseudomonadales bacterium]
MNIPSRPTRRTRAKHGGQKPSIESRLLSATERLLEKGNTFAALTIEELSKEAGISRGTFYLHFKNKGELVTRLLDHFTEELSVNLGTWTSNADAAERKDVSDAVRSMVETFRKHKAIIVAVRDTMPHDKDVEEIYFGMIKKVSEMAKKSTGTIKKRGKSRTRTTDDVADALAVVIALYSTYMIDKQDDKSIKNTSRALGYICESAIFSDDS